MVKAISQEERMRMKKERSEKRKATLKTIGKGVGKTLSAVKEVVLKNPKIREGVKEAAKKGIEALADNATVNQYLYGVPKKLKEFIGPVVDAIDTKMGPRYENPKKPAFDYKNDPAFKPYIPTKPAGFPDRPYSHSRFAIAAN